MKSSSRIVINTGVTYLRSILGVGFALFSSRWILQALGATDFGLFQVVGSLIVVLTFFNSVMASSAARHFAFAIGKGDTEDVNRWFNTSLNIHLILPAILIVIGWPIAEYAIRNWLTIPPERVESCVIVFRISLINPHFPALRSGHRLFQWLSPGKQFPSNSLWPPRPWMALWEFTKSTTSCFFFSE